MGEQKSSDTGTLPTIEQAVDAFFDDFDFGDGGRRTRLSYLSGARCFLDFVRDHEELDSSTSITELPSSASADFNAWMQTAEHTGPGPEANVEEQEIQRGYSASTRRLYLQALSRMLRFWWYREWLSFSPEDEARARESLQIRKSRQDRRSVYSRTDQVPPDFGDRMLSAADSLPLPSEEDISNDRDRRKVRLQTLRTRAIVITLRATALRAGDLCDLTRTAVRLAARSGGHLRLEMSKTGRAAHIMFGEAALGALEAYLEERNDASPWLFIQHGRTGAPPRGRQLSAEAYRRRQRGYGARLGPGSVRRIVVSLARRAGYDPERDQFVSTHAFRHWHAQRLIDLGASIDQVQSVLGHARAQTTKDVYAPEPNIPQIMQWEERIQTTSPNQRASV